MALSRSNGCFREFTQWAAILGGGDAASPRTALGPKDQGTRSAKRGRGTSSPRFPCRGPTPSQGEREAGSRTQKAAPNSQAQDPRSKIQDPSHPPTCNATLASSTAHHATTQHRSTAAPLRCVSSSSLFSSLPFQGFLTFSILASSSSTTPTGSLVPRTTFRGPSTISTRPNRRPLCAHYAPRGRSTHKSVAFVDGIRAAVT
ncbi:hypothetical protein CSHISOI_06423 [Colletotrichum shisoi]|uniref:Uncharacterized protein n=1 Tax=Colletotrichum shisoi TaxID=2078593 RepID=A0A5Q4BQT8_9PEZI|nr:hypothetical protein CSHISOI_06423 [Colletotrichum shisoi]